MANKAKVIPMLSELERAAQYERLLYCPACQKPMAEHPSEQAYRCLRSLAEKDMQALRDSLTKG